MRRSTYAARSAGLIQSEILENRRLFAGMPGFGGHGEFGHHFGGGPRGPGAEAIIVSLPLGGFMRSTSDGNSTTAYSSSYSINRTMASTSSASASGESTNATNSAQVIRTAATSRAPEAVAVNVRAAGTDIASEPPVVQQILPESNTTADTAARSATADVLTDVARGPVFGPFTLGTISRDSSQTAANHEGSLLTLDPDAVDRSLRWQSQDATYRPKRAASPTVGREEYSLETAAHAALHVQQATLAPVPIESAGRPLWQRLATVAAAGLLVVTNTIVRRRQRRAAKVMAR